MLAQFDLHNLYKSWFVKERRKINKRKHLTLCCFQLRLDGYQFGQVFGTVQSMLWFFHPKILATVFTNYMLWNGRWRKTVFLIVDFNHVMKGHQNSIPTHVISNFFTFAWGKEETFKGLGTLSIQMHLHYVFCR